MIFIKHSQCIYILYVLLCLCCVYLLLCLCCVYLLSGNSALHIYCAAGMSACLLDLERFSYGRGRSRSLLPCPAMSTLTSCLACSVSVRLQHACVRPCALQIVPSHHMHPISLTISTALPTCHLRCMSNKLIFLICIYRGRYVVYVASERVRCVHTCMHACIYAVMIYI
jgi:hypothetical protein